MHARRPELRGAAIIEMTLTGAAQCTRAASLLPTRRPRMEKMLHLLETFTARGSDGQLYRIQAYEHLARLDAVRDPQGQWESTGLAEYKLDDGRHVSVDREGTMTLPDSGVRLMREPRTHH
jgi:hypothetical protein